MKEKQKKKLSRRAAEKIDNAGTEELAAMTVQSLAKELNASERHLSRTFKADYHCTPGEYIEQAKINKAAHLLETTDLTVKEISKRLDYSKPGYFSDVFKKHKGLSPKKYRENHKSQPEKETQTPQKEESIWQILKNKIIKWFQTIIK
jgi:AraC-like DNA-binding protein